MVIANLRDAWLRWSFYQFWRRLLLGCLGLTLLFLLINMALSWQWIDRPFAGFLHSNRVITETNLASWAASITKDGERQPENGDVIVAVNDQEVSSSGQINAYVRQQRIGQRLTYTLAHRTGQADTFTRATARFTRQNFIELVIIPAFIASLALLTAAVAIYHQADLLQARLFTLWVLALVYTLASRPELGPDQLFPFNMIVALAGKIVLPPLLLHFLLIFPYPRERRKSWPFLLPLIYLPVLPALVYLPALLIQPEATRPFNTLISSYTVLYVLASGGLLLQAARQASRPLARKQAGVLLLGLILPTLLTLSLHFSSNNAVNLTLIYSTLDRYGWVGLPFASAIAALRFELFDLKRSQRLHVLYAGAIAVMLMGYFLLVTIINPTTIHLSYLRIEDVRVMAGTSIAFLVLRPLYSLIRHRLEQRFHGSVEDFRIGLRLFQQELLKVKSRHDLEALVSWNIPADFRLRSAELSQRGRPSSPYSLPLPVLVNNISLGTLFFGSKINGEEFTERERRILLELQKQLALALWSLELDEAIRTTEELTRLKSKFMANVTHELRTPLNGIINYIGFVVDGDTGPLNPEQTSYLSQALQSAEKLLALINNILDMSKIEAGQMTLQLQLVNLTEVVAETVPRAAELLGNKPVQMMTDLASTLPIVPADRLRLRQIILNLLTNAAKFTDSGQVWLKAYPENGHVVIQVSDTGRGIQADLLPAIFQQFTGEGLADRDEYSGTRLSLPVTRSLVELHGGHIRVESQVGQGTTFTVMLPIKQNEDFYEHR